MGKLIFKVACSFDPFGELIDRTNRANYYSNPGLVQMEATSIFEVSAFHMIRPSHNEAESLLLLLRS